MVMAHVLYMHVGDQNANALGYLAAASGMSVTAHVIVCMRRYLTMMMMLS
jgi:hypothetical protein